MIKRAIFADLKSHLSQKEITFLVGPRQAGKTTLLFALKDYLEKKSEKTIFFNLDIEKDKQYVKSQATLIRKIGLEIGKHKGYVFIDEIQRKENAGIFLKGIYDMNLPYKFIISGSGSVELKEKVHESLAGRKRVFALSTLTFWEFVNYKTAYKYEKRMVDFLSLEKETSRDLLDEYLTFGGYPQVVLAESTTEKQKMIEEIYQSYLEKDLTYLLKVRKTEVFTSLVRLIASQIGNLVNYSELASTLGISVKTVKEYLWYLDKTFVLKKVTPYFRNIRKEITKAPIFYFSDMGLRNYSLGTFGNLNELPEAGFLFQNFLFNILQETKTVSSQIHFWRTKDGAEVDFVIDKVKEVVALEAKFKQMKREEVSRSLRSFIEKYKPKKTFVVNLTLKKSLFLKETKIYFLPFWLMLEKNRGQFNI
ncbi:ATP-binding protein [Candidatus Gottesmanbacteria bacterium]|nr:ATP-binding protein [Candidatus Gottesmanbacteria bacterium]